MRNKKLFLNKVSTSSVVVLDRTEMSPIRKLNLTELSCTSTIAISPTIGLIRVHWSSNHPGSFSIPRANGVLVRQRWRGSWKEGFWISRRAPSLVPLFLFLFEPLSWTTHFFHHRVVRKCPERSSPPCPQSYSTFLLPHPTYVSGLSEYFTPNDWLRTELLGGSWIGLKESVRDTVQCVTRRCSFFNNNIHCDRKLMKIVPTTNSPLIISYTWGIKVVQWTVSYAPGGRSLRDVNAKTKVTARAMIYSITPDTGPKWKTV